VATVKQALAAAELFKGLTDEELDKVAALGRMEVYEKSAPLFVQGATAESFYVVELGRVALSLAISSGAGSSKEITVETIKNGQSCGYSAVKGAPVYALSAKAVEPVRVISIDGKRLYDLLKENPVMGYKVMSRMASSLSSTLRNVRSTIQIFRR
jgi:CRP/FNR family cyclic AMP-dependent transcriptional regulator